jgi:tRNA A-37 threonylcarbamoyl transferase component Bud32
MEQPAKNLRFSVTVKSGSDALSKSDSVNRCRIIESQLKYRLDQLTTKELKCEEICLTHWMMDLKERLQKKYRKRQMSVAEIYKTRTGRDLRVIMQAMKLVKGAKLYKPMTGNYSKIWRLVILNSI